VALSTRLLGRYLDRSGSVRVGCRLRSKRWRVRLASTAADEIHSVIGFSKRRRRVQTGAVLSTMSFRTPLIWFTRRRWCPPGCVNGNDLRKSSSNRTASTERMLRDDKATTGFGRRTLMSAEVRHRTDKRSAPSTRTLATSVQGRSQRVSEGL